MDCPLLLPRHISRKQDRKQSSWDWSRHASMRCWCHKQWLNQLCRELPPPPAVPWSQSPGLCYNVVECKVFCKLACVS